MEKLHFLRYTYTHLRLLHNKDTLLQISRMIFCYTTALTDAVYFKRTITNFSNALIFKVYILIITIIVLTFFKTFQGHSYSKIIFQHFLVKVFVKLITVHMKWLLNYIVRTLFIFSFQLRQTKTISLKLNVKISMVK